ncbi:cyclodeaminase/cyclohydrolase family protein [Terrisporobacter mayombei]|uniref:Methenyltetrahydrofolate cyclohydrolase n=1 Tax=Terrisporobacter mayombei TaxID=1541 RepID=A0ABY9Q1X9_9FIRM|nr:cyclodeaminase/cyclohydrolase family protein [Terrisporobacter mayombei]MCC3867688.1 cyclodeaminase/cyclohydrolase family protein [Terrisporobacter mayombei]WMT81950.1 Methenyltetrahydrofolate cyclohydrolase [Terrisporobacter mayombei]
MKLIDMTVTNFTNEVDSNSPAPGGGSVAALASDIGIGLSRMMAHLSFGKKKYEALDDAVKEEFEVRFDKLGKIREEMSRLVDEDTQSFNEFMKALKMPKDTFKQITERQQAMADATLYSIKVPYKTAALSLDAIKELEFLVDNGNRNAITDIGVGTLMLCTGLEGAILNVKVNLMSLENKELAKKYADSCAEMLEQGKEMRDKILNKIHSAIE